MLSIPTLCRRSVLVAITFAFCVSSPGVPNASAAPMLRLLQGSWDPLLEAVPVSAELTIAEASGIAPWIIQFEAPTSETEVQMLAGLGLEVHGYLPDFAYLVTGTSDRAESARAATGVRWVGHYEPGLRLSPQIGTLEFVDPERAEAEAHYLYVRVFSDPQAVADRLAQTPGLAIVEIIENEYEAAVVVDALAERIDAIAFDPLVWFVSEIPEGLLFNSTTSWVVQSNTNNQTPIWDQGLDGTGEIVTLMDSGLDYNSCYFRENGNAVPGPTHRKVIDYSNFGGQAYDGCSTGHGTHVAGTIAGDQSYINGSTQNAGMAPAAKLTVQDVGRDGFLECLFGLVSVPASLTAAFTASYDLEARIHSNSWGSTSNAYDNYAVNVDQFMWNNPDFLIVFAAGNSGSGAGTVGSPATAKNLISVGATQQAPNQSTIAGYSSRGPASDGRIKPTLVAPGGDSNGYIVSANNNSGNPPSATCSTQGSPFAGTSMATPAVSGLAALTRQYFRDGFYPLGQSGGDVVAPTAALVKAVLVNAAADVGTANIPNQNEGFGRVLLDDALYFSGESRELRVEEEVGLTTGEIRSFNYEIESSSEPFEIALVWTDAPGSQGAGVALVNDVHLRVTGPGGQIYWGNVFSGGQSQTGGSPDLRNVEELFRLNSPTVGSYTIDVVGNNIPMATQPFALASTGSFANWPEDPASTPMDDLRTQEWDLLSTNPNPFTNETSIVLRVPDGVDSASLGIFDATGRAVRQLGQVPVPAGIHYVNWDGAADSGQSVAPGVYFLRVEVDGQVQLSRRLVRVR